MAIHTKSDTRKNGHEIISSERIRVGRDSEIVLRRAKRQHRDLASAVEAFELVVSQALGLLATRKDMLYEGSNTRDALARAVALLKTTIWRYKKEQVEVLLDNVVTSYFENRVQ